MLNGAPDHVDDDDVRRRVREAAAPLAVLAAQGAPADLGDLDTALAPLRARSESDRVSSQLAKARDALLAAKDDGAMLVAASQLRVLASQRVPDRLAAGRFSMLDAQRDVAPKAWMCRAFQWIPGRTAMGIGYPGAGKTFSLLSAMTALSVGRAVWGNDRICGPRHPRTGYARALRCLYVDLDAGLDEVRNRLGRLIRGMGINDDEVARAREEIREHHGVDVEYPIEGLALSDVPNPGSLVLASYEQPALADFRAAWIELIRGFDLVLVDPMRDLAPFADENDSRIGAVPRELGAASRAAGAAIVLVHHAGRSAPAKRGQPAKVPQHASRGSSAIDGKAGSQLVFERDAQGRRMVTMVRDADPDDDEGMLAPLYLSLRRAPGEAEITAVNVDEEESAAASGEPTLPGINANAKVDTTRGSGDVDFALLVLRANPGIAGKDDLYNAICDAAKRRGKRKGGPLGTDRARAAVRVLSDKGLIENRPTADKPPRPRLFYCEPKPEPRPEPPDE